MAVAILMALSAGASATVIHAPYKAVTSTFSYTDVSGCATGGVTSPINWSATSGSFTTGEKASAKNCGKSLAGVGGNSYGSGESEFEFAVPVHINTSTTHSIVVNWKIHATTSKSYVPGLCTAPTTTASFWYCEVGAGWSMGGEAYLVDLTNGSYFYGTYWYTYNESYNETFYSGSYYNYSFNGSYGHTGSVSYFINTTTLNRADSYALAGYIYLDSYAYVESYGGSKLTGGAGSSSITAFGGSNKVVLSSIVVT